MHRKPPSCNGFSNSTLKINHSKLLQFAPKNTRFFASGTISRLAPPALRSLGVAGSARHLGRTQSLTKLSSVRRTSRFGFLGLQSGNRCLSIRSSVARVKARQPGKASGRRQVKRRLPCEALAKQGQGVFVKKKTDLSPPHKY